MTTLRKAMPFTLFCAALLVTCLPLAAQNNPDCSFTFTATGDDSTMVGKSNLSGQTPCVNWRVTFSTTATLTTQVTFQTSPDGTTWTAVPNTICSAGVQPPCIIQGTNPTSSGAQGMIYLSLYGNYVRVITSGSAGAGTATVRAYGAKGASASAGGSVGGNSGNLWTLNGTTLSPANSGDSVLVGTTVFLQCSGTSTDRASIAAAISSLSAGGTLNINGTCNLSGAGTELIQIPANKNMHIDCGNWTSTQLVIAASVSTTTTDVFRVVGPNTGTIIENCQTYAPVGAPARYGINLDATSGIISQFVIRHNHLSPSTGNAVYITFPSGSDGVFDGVLEDNLLFGGINLTRGGDNIRLTRNQLLGVGPGIYASLVSGAVGPEIYFNTITSCSGGIVIAQGATPKIENNSIEPAAGCATEANGASIDILGSSGNPVLSPQVFNNSCSIQAGLNTSCIRFDYVTTGKIISNTCYTNAGSSEFCIALTAHPTGTIYGLNDLYGSGTLLSSSETDASALASLNVAQTWGALQTFPSIQFPSGGAVGPRGQYLDFYYYSGTTLSYYDGVSVVPGIAAVSGAGAVLPQPGEALVFKSANGTCYPVTMSNIGVLTAGTSITCPI